MFWPFKDFHLTSNCIWIQIDVKFSHDVTDWWGFSVRKILGPFFEVSTDDVIRSVKNTQKCQKQDMARPWMCVQHHLFGVPAEGQFLVLFHCVKVGLDVRRYDNWNNFFFLGGRGRRGAEREQIFGFFKIS